MLITKKYFSSRTAVFTMAKKIVMYLSVFIFSALMGKISVLNEIAPFGASLIAAAAITKKEYYIPVCLGVILGSFALIELSMWYYMCVNGICAMLCFLIPKKAKHIAVFGALILSYSLSFFIILPQIPYNIIAKGCEMLFACAFVFIFEIALKTITIKRMEISLKEEEIIALSFLCILLVLSLGKLAYNGIYFANICALFFALAFSYLGGAGLGCACGVALGCASALAGANSLFFIGCLGICALGGGVLRRLNRFAVAVALVLIYITLNFMFTGENTFNFLDAVAAAVIFILIPNKTLLALGRFIDINLKRKYDSEISFDRFKKTASERLREISKLFAGIGDMFCLNVETNVNEFSTNEIINELAAHNCARCALKNTCWDRDFNETYASLDNLYLTYEQTGKVSKKSLDEEFTKRCMCTDKLIANAKQVFPQYIISKKWHKALEETKMVTAQQLSGAAKVIEKLSDDMSLGEKFITREANVKFNAVTGFAQKALGEVCGDIHTHLKLRDSRFLILLCDGMGHGERACSEAQACVNLIENFYSAGFDEHTILRTINRLMVLKDDDDIFTTVDLCVIDLITGEAKFTKIGSERSFLLRGDELMCMSAGALPLGILEEFNPATLKKHLMDGDILIMVTDGVGDIIGDLVEKWLLETLENRDNPQELAQNILNRALQEAEEGEAKDDMSVMVTKIIKI